ncbi:uncharacterized protein LOC110373359 [Helicoverpa armigera]|uniref:uncharacterized protein LOC110373359 n=1 Tax=Helicoverpa armigera TaxID=29058 RepID=UPI003083D7DA
MFSMYRVVFSSFLFVAVSATLTKEDCRNYLNSDYLLFCCKNEFPSVRIPMLDDVSECEHLDPASCERSLCIAKKLGVATADDRIDKAKAVELLYAKLTNEPSLMEDVQSKCIDGDVESYAPAEACESVKLTRCVSMQWLKRCTDWDDDSECQKFKDGVQECATLLE